MKAPHSPSPGPWAVPLADVLVDDELRAAVDEVISSGWWSMGPKVLEFEGAFAEFCEVEHAFAVANGTAALHLALLAAGCAPGDEVVLPSLTSSPPQTRSRTPERPRSSATCSGRTT